MAQDVPAEAAPAPDATAPAEASPPAAASASFTDEQVEGFAEAAIGMRAIAADASLDEAGKQAKAVELVAEAGIDPQTFNAIGQAMQSDVALAERVQVAAAAKQAAPEG